MTLLAPWLNADTATDMVPTFATNVPCMGPSDFRVRLTAQLLTNVTLPASIVVALEPRLPPPLPPLPTTPPPPPLQLTNIRRVKLRIEDMTGTIK